MYRKRYFLAFSANCGKNLSHLISARVDFVPAEFSHFTKRQWQQSWAIQVFVPSRTQRKDEIQSITCESCGHSISASPLIQNNIHTGVLEVKTHPHCEWSKTRVRIEKEAITSDEFLEFLEKETERKACKSKKSTRSDTAQTVDVPESESDGKLPLDW